MANLEHLKCWRFSAKFGHFEGIERDLFLIRLAFALNPKDFR
jgi:hypothetical protein